MLFRLSDPPLDVLAPLLDLSLLEVLLPDSPSTDADTLDRAPGEDGAVVVAELRGAREERAGPKE